MSDVTLPHTISPGNQRSPNQLQANFEALRNGVNDLSDANVGTDFTDAVLASPNNSVYKKLLFVGGLVDTDLAAATYLLPTAATLSSSYASPASNVTSLALIYLDDADYSVGSCTTKLRVRGVVTTNATQPTVNFTFGLYPIAAAGAADTLTLTAGTVVSGSTALVSSPAASNGGVPAVSTDFNVPSDGNYGLGLVTSGALTNNARVMISAALQTRNV